MWDAGMSLGPNTDGNTFPNTDMYQGGLITASGITIDIQELSGSNFKVKVTMGKRSADKDDLLSSTPSKHDALQSAAEEQFRTPDADEFRMSGKLPQLPWFDEFVAAGGLQTPPSEEDSTIAVWDSVAEQSRAPAYEGLWVVGLGSLMAGVVANF